MGLEAAGCDHLPTGRFFLISVDAGGLVVEGQRRQSGFFLGASHNAFLRGSGAGIRLHSPSDTCWGVYPFLGGFFANFFFCPHLRG